MSGAAPAYLGGIVRIGIAADKSVINIHLNNRLAVDVLPLVNVYLFNKGVNKFIVKFGNANVVFNQLGEFLGTATFVREITTQTAGKEKK